MTPRVALLLGDPSGIGPELCAKLLVRDDVRATAHLLVVGDEALLAAGAVTAGVQPIVRTVHDAAEARPGPDGPVLLHCPPRDAAPYPPAQANARSGAYVLETLSLALGLAREGRVDAICFAPLNKQAMSLAGSPFGDELHWFAHELGWEGFVCEINTFDRLWTTRVTSHIGLAQVAASITGDGVRNAVALAHHTLLSAGYERPRIAVAALNPHGGEGGLFGREELDVIGPAIEQAREQRIDARGPFPSDTVFIKARDGEFDAVVTMYHDQGQIAMKLMGFERGVTVQAGLPIPVTTPAHGTAFDIAGQGVANPEGLRQALLLAARMGAHQRAAMQPAP